MSIPPRPSRAQYEDALHRIHDRRRRAGDDHPLAMSEDPREVLAYLRQRGRTGLRADASGDDITDALVLRLWLWWEGEAAELWLLEAAESLGRRRKDLGEVLGVKTGQGLVDRITRTRRLLDRAAPEPETESVPAPAANLRQVAAELVASRAHMPDTVDELYLDQVATALRGWRAGDPPPTPVAASALRLLVADLSDADLPPGSVLREVTDRAVGLLRRTRSEK